LYRKKIIIKEDKTLLAGMRIEDADMVYDLNLKNTLNRIVEHISE
jgi:F0F1-type ATP synthase delta subunit